MSEISHSPLSVSSWPLVVIIEDCYVPEWAGEIVKLTEASTIEADYGSILALAILAEVNLRKERLN